MELSRLALSLSAVHLRPIQVAEHARGLFLCVARCLWYGSRLPEHLLKDAGFYTSNK